MHSELPVLPQTRDFLDRPLKMLIGDGWQDAASGATLDFRNPPRAMCWVACPPPPPRMSTAPYVPRARPSTTRPGAACARASGRTCCGAWPT